MIYIYCPKCKVRQSANEFDYIEEPIKDPLIVCSLCNGRFTQGESLDFEWDSMIRSRMDKFPKIFFKEYLELMESLRGIKMHPNWIPLQYKSELQILSDISTVEFFQRWNLFKYFQIEKHNEREVKHIKLYEISESPIFKEIFRIYFGINIHDDNALKIVSRDQKINEVIS